MSKIEALKELKHWKETNNENGVVWLPLFAVENIEEALEELQTIRETKPSEELMFIQELLNISETKKHFINLANYDTRLNLIKTKQTLQKAQEQEKILDILKRIIKIKPSDLYEFELVVRGTDEEENTIKEWVKC